MLFGRPVGIHANVKILNGWNVSSASYRCVATVFPNFFVVGLWLANLLCDWRLAGWLAGWLGFSVGTNLLSGCLGWMARGLMAGNNIISLQSELKIFAALRAERNIETFYCFTFNFMSLPP